MDFLKKLAIALTSLLMVAGVVYIIVLSMNSYPGNPPQVAAVPPAPSPPQTEVPADTTASSQEAVPPVSKAPSEPLQNTPSSGDTINWRHGPLTPGTIAPPELEAPGRWVNPNPFFIAAAKRILPAVVSIHSTRKMPKSFRNFHWFLPPKKDKEGEGDSENPEEEFQPGTGSGIIISENGYILTNYHVVQGAQGLRVVLYDKREFTARLVGADPTTDIALIKVEAKDLPVAVIGNSDSLQIGEWVMAVGNPLNFTSTVTAGIISAFGRDIRIINEQYRIENFIQTDAVINPGNSGGALVNLNGEVIGINTAIATRTGLYQGYGFAIPINLARKVADDLLLYGRVRRGFLGVSIENVTDALAKGVGLPRPMGALVQGVQPGYPAQQAGIRQGDIIIGVEGQQVMSVNDLQVKIARHHPGDKVRLTIWRDGKPIEITVTLGEAPLQENVEVPEKKLQPIKFKNLGMVLKDISEEERRSLGLSSGVLIEKVYPDSPADAGRVFTGEVLLSVNDKPIRSVQEFEELLSRTKPGSVLKLRLWNRFSGENERIAYVEVPR